MAQSGKVPELVKGRPRIGTWSCLIPDSMLLTPWLCCFAELAGNGTVMIEMQS